MYTHICIYIYIYIHIHIYMYIHIHMRVYVCHMLLYSCCGIAVVFYVFFRLNNPRK